MIDSFTSTRRFEIDALKQGWTPATWFAFGIYTLAAVGGGLAIAAKLFVLLGTRIPHAGLVFAIVAILVAVAFPLVVNYALRFERFIAVAALVLIAVFLLVIAPKFASLHAEGRGTDQGDCIAVAAKFMLHGSWPYDRAAMWSHNPMSCGPAWVALHLPLVAVATYPIAVLCLLMTAFAVMAYWTSLSQVARFVALLAFVPNFWLGLANGNDFPTFAVILALTTVLAASAYLERALVFGCVAVLAVAVSHARLPFLLLPVALFMGAAERLRWKALGVQLVAIVIWFCFYGYGPESFVQDGPMHVVGKFAGTSSALPLISMAIVMIAAIAGTFVSRWLSGWISNSMALLLYLAAILIPTSVLNLMEKIAQKPYFLEALTYWEGTSWLAGLACFAAWIVFWGQGRSNGQVSST